MNDIPLKDRQPADKVDALKLALKGCFESTQSIRTAMTWCKANGFRSLEARLAIAAAHIVCTPGRVQRDYADNIRGDLLALQGSDREMARLYSHMAVKAMEAIVARMGNLAHEEKLSKEYAYAIKVEKALCKELERSSVAA